MTREGSQRTEQINKDTKGTRERGTEAAVHGAILDANKVKKGVDQM